MKNTFVEICIYEVKPNKTKEFEDLIVKVVKHHQAFSGVIDVKYMKRTHRSDFKTARSGQPAIRLKRAPRSVTYVLYWELRDAKVHGQATKSGLERFYKEFNRCLAGIPKIILGGRIQ